jgi:hypothetical protein
MSDAAVSTPYDDVTPADSPKTFADILAEPDFIKLAMPNLVEGETCFDFELPVHDFSTGQSAVSDKTFHLMSECANQPVALIFGSYT